MTESSDSQEKSGYMKRLMQGTVLSVINFFVILALSWWITPIQVHTLGERLNGIWQAVAALTGWYAILDFGLNYTVSRFITKTYSTKEYDECNIYASTGFGLFLVMAAIALILSLVFGFGASYFFPKIEDIGLIGTVVILSGAAIALDFPMRAFTGVSLGTMRHDLVGLASIIFRIAGAVMTWLILVSGGRLIALALGNIAFVMVQMGVHYALARHSFPQLCLSHKFMRRTHVRSLVGYSVYGFIAHIGNAFIFQIDKLVIAVLRGVEYVTPYGLAIQFADHFRGLLMTLTNWMVTWLTFLHAQGHKAELLKTMRFGFKLCTYISGFIAFGLIAWSEPFITRWMLTPEAIETGKVNPVFWKDVISCVALLTLSTLVRTVQDPNIRYLYATANHRYYALSTLIEGALKVELCIIFSLQYGLVGFALGNLIAALIVWWIYIPKVTCRLLERSLFIYYCELLWLFLLVGFALIVPAVVTRQLVAPNYPSLFLVGGISTVTYFPVVYLIGFSSEERRKIMGVFDQSKNENRGGNESQ